MRTRWMIGIIGMGAFIYAGYRDDLAAESGLQEFEFVEREAGNAAVIGVLDLAIEAEGGADEAVMIFAVGLDFQMEIVRSWHG